MAVGCLQTDRQSQWTHSTRTGEAEPSMGVLMCQKPCSKMKHFSSIFVTVLFETRSDTCYSLPSVTDPILCQQAASAWTLARKPSQVIKQDVSRASEGPRQANCLSAVVASWHSHLNNRGRGFSRKPFRKAFQDALDKQPSISEGVVQVDAPFKSQKDSRLKLADKQTEGLGSDGEDVHRL